MADFEILPAIDLRAGRAVRLYQGDFGHEVFVDDDPIGVALRFVEAGARWLHIVDLDGARAGEPRQADTVRKIRNAVPRAVSIEAAGGFRTPAAATAMLSEGVARVVLGSLAMRDPTAIRDLVGRHGAHAIAVAMDIRGDRVQSDAWERSGGTPLEAALRLVEASQAEIVEVTSIERDGTLTGPDVLALGRISAALGRSVVAGGGIRDLDDLLALRAAGCSGAIIGRALYEGAIDLSAALEAVAASTL